MQYIFRQNGNWIYNFLVINFKFGWRTESSRTLDSNFTSNLFWLVFCILTSVRVLRSSSLVESLFFTFFISFSSFPLILRQKIKQRQKNHSSIFHFFLLFHLKIWQKKNKLQKSEIQYFNKPTRCADLVQIYNSLVSWLDYDWFDSIDYRWYKSLKIRQPDQKDKWKVLMRCLTETIKIDLSCVLKVLNSNFNSIECLIECLIYILYNVPCSHEPRSDVFS